MNNEWQPIETAPIKPFDPVNWFDNATPRLLLWNGYGVNIGAYSYTQKGKGRWQTYAGVAHPTHWMPLPAPPAD